MRISKAIPQTSSRLRRSSRFDQTRETTDSRPRRTSQRSIAIRFPRALEGLLNDGQLASWRLMEKFITGMIFQGGVRKREYGIERENLDQQLLHDLRKVYALEEDQLAQLEHLTPSYLGDARVLLERFGQNKAQLESLSQEVKRRLDEEFIELQGQLERKILPLLSEEQRKVFVEKHATLFRFTYGTGSNSSSFTGVF